MTGITTILLGGQKRTLSFKNNFLFLLGVTLKCDPMDAPEKIEQICREANVMRAMATIIYCGLCAYQERIANYEHGIKLPEIAELVDDAKEEDMKPIWDLFIEVMGIPKASEDQIKAYEEKLKKKVISLKKNQTKKSA